MDGGITAIISCLMSQKRKKKKPQHSCPAECEGREGWKDVWNSNIGCVMFYFTRINGDEICMKQLETATEIEYEAEQKRPQNLAAEPESHPAAHC